MEKDCIASKPHRATFVREQMHRLHGGTIERENCCIPQVFENSRKRANEEGVVLGVC